MKYRLARGVPLGLVAQFSFYILCLITSNVPVISFPSRSFMFYFILRSIGRLLLWLLQVSWLKKYRPRQQKSPDPENEERGHCLKESRSAANPQQRGNLMQSLFYKSCAFSIVFPICPSILSPEVILQQIRFISVIKPFMSLIRYDVCGWWIRLTDREKSVKVFQDLRVHSSSGVLELIWMLSIQMWPVVAFSKIPSITTFQKEKFK